MWSRSGSPPESGSLLGVGAFLLRDTPTLGTYLCSWSWIRRLFHLHANNDFCSLFDFCHFLQSSWLLLNFSYNESFACTPLYTVVRLLLEEFRFFSPFLLKHTISRSHSRSPTKNKDSASVVIIIINEVCDNDNTRVIIDIFQKYRRYSISMPALKVSSIPISILCLKSINIEIDTSISILL